MLVGAGSPGMVRVTQIVVPRYVAQAPRRLPCREMRDNAALWKPGAAVDRRGQCPRTGPAPNDAPGRCAQDATMRKRTVRALPVRPVVPFGVTRRT